jgi:hypothetical protein
VIVLGVAGLLAHLVVTVPPQSAGVVAGASWFAIGVGSLLLLTAIAQRGYGYGVFPLALGIGVLVADRVTHFTGLMHDPQPLFGILVTLLIGTGALAVSYAEGVDEAVLRLPFFAVASLVSDIFVDFGADWDDLVNLGTAAFAAAFVVTAVVAIFLGGTLPGSAAAEDFRAGWLLLAAAIGTGAAFVLVTIVATFDLAGFVHVLLTAAAVVGGYLVMPLLAYFLLYVLAGRDVPDAVIWGAIDSMERGLAAIGALVAGFFAVVALVALIFWGPPGWLVAVLVVVVVVAAAAAGWWGYQALTDLVRLIRLGALPGRIAAVLNDLRRSDPVFRLLPG